MEALEVAAVVGVVAVIAFLVYRSAKKDTTAPAPGTAPKKWPEYPTSEK